MPLKERTGSISPADASIGNDGGRGVVEYWVYPEYDDEGVIISDIATELRAAITQLLGDTSFECGANGKLIRTPPLAHPVFPWMFCTKLDSIKGYGLTELLGTGEEFYEAPPLANYAESQIYLIRASFNALPYTILPDAKINTRDFTVYADDGTGSYELIPEEWLRYTDVQKGDVEAEVITAQYGAMKLRGTPGGDKQFPAMPSLVQPRAALLVTHYFVPYIWFTHTDNHYDQAVGRVNQTTIFGRPPGQLLLQRVRARRYTPPIPEMISVDDLSLRPSQERLADIEMTFSVMPRAAAVSYTPANSSFVVGGHNLLPHIDRKYYYTTTAQSGETAETGTPSYLSYEMHKLFKDPRA